MIEVYYAAPSVYGRKVLAVLDEKNLDYTIKKMSFESQDHKCDAYLKLNPNGEIPTLIDDGFIIYESTAIVEYLNDEYPEPPLMPETSEGKARVRMAEDYCDLHIYPALIECLKKQLQNQEITEEDKAAVVSGMKRIATYLGTQNYVAGDFSLADCAVMPVIASMDAMGFLASVTSSAAMKAYVNRLKARPGYQGANLLVLE